MAEVQDRKLMFGLVGVLWASKECLDGLWGMSGKCLEGVWKASRRCLEGV